VSGHSDLAIQTQLAENMQAVKPSLCMQAIPGQAVAVGENCQCVLDDRVWEIVPESVEGVLHSYVPPSIRPIHHKYQCMQCIQALSCLQNLVHV